MLNQGALFLGGRIKIYFVQPERKEWRTLSEKALCKYCSFYVLKSCIFFLRENCLFLTVSCHFSIGKPQDMGWFG